MVRYSDTHPSENAILITQYQVDKHPREKCDRPCNVIVGAVVTVEPCQKVFEYADIHHSVNTISITMQQLDKHPQEKCEITCNETVEAEITVDLCQKVSRYATYRAAITA